jgi:hypothetical protein
MHRSLWRHAVVKDFAWAAGAFAVNHGALNIILAVASSLLGPGLGGYSIGLFYGFTVSSAVERTPAGLLTSNCFDAQVFTSIFLACAIVRRLGDTLGMAIAELLCGLFVASYAVASLAPEMRGPIVMVGSAAGGVGVGFLWTAQGVFFTNTAEEYARATGCTPAAARASLAGIFATIYLLGELCLKFLAAALFQAAPGFPSLAILGAIALAASAGAGAMVARDRARAAGAAVAAAAGGGGGGSAAATGSTGRGAPRLRASSSDRSVRSLPATPLLETPLAGAAHSVVNYGSYDTSGSSRASRTPADARQRRKGGTSCRPPAGVTEAGSLLLRDPICALIYPTQMSFGMTAALVNYYVCSRVL